MKNFIKVHKVFSIISLVSFVLIVVALILLSRLIFNRFSRGILPTDEDLKYLKDNDLVYDRVIIFGVDGAGGYFEEMDTPNFDRIFKEELPGAITYSAIAQVPTNSGENWTSILHGVRYFTHKTDNDVSGREPFTNDKYPSFFKVYGERHPDTYMASVCNWNNINNGIIENDIPGLVKINGDTLIKEDLSNLDGLERDKYIDTLVSKEVINQIIENDPKILYMHFDCVDAAGHSFGRGKPQYIDAIKHIDNLMGNIYDVCKEEGIKDNTLFICISDHGHLRSGGHGNNLAPVRKVVFAVAGSKNIIKGKMGFAVTQDVASVVLYALGEKQPDAYESEVPKKIFANLG